MKKVVFVLFLFAAIAQYSSCSFTLSGASIPPEMKTINVEVFENNALLVYPTLSNDMTESLKSRIRSQTALSIIRNPDADATFTGSITTYSIAPVSIQATGSNTNQAPIANASRLTITVRAKYTYKNNRKLDFEQDFTRTADFTGDISDKEKALTATLNKQITEDIFNKAFANWN